MTTNLVTHTIQIYFLQGQRSEFLKSSSHQAAFLLEAISLLLASRGCLNSWPHDHILHIQSQKHNLFRSRSHSDLGFHSHITFSLTLPLQPPLYKGTCDYIGLCKLTPDNFPITKSLITSAKFQFQKCSLPHWVSCSTYSPNYRDFFKNELTALSETMREFSKVDTQMLRDSSLSTMFVYQKCCERPSCLTHGKRLKQIQISLEQSEARNRQMCGKGWGRPHTYQYPQSSLIQQILKQRLHP